jgi:MFS family permease
MKQHPIETRRLGALSVFVHRDFRNYILARFLSSLAMMMLSVAVGWQVYDMTRDPIALGFVGLAQFLPAFLLALPGGHAADRFDRGRIVLAALGLQLGAAAALLALTLFQVNMHHAVFAVLTLVGIARAFFGPASQSIVPLLVPERDIARAVAWNSTSFQSAFIAGPALGGALYLFGAAAVYASAAGLLVVSAALVSSLKKTLRARSETAGGIESVLAGVRYVWSRKEILGAVSLDLFAVLFGGATALLPIYASDILHTGPLGLGLLRSAPAVGAALTAVWLARRPLQHHAGRNLFIFVAVFGLSTVIFGISPYFPLSMAALLVLGAADMVSVVIRHTLVQIRTPDSMRGRVSAVNSIFIGASNELGEFESGVTAGLFGTVPAVVLGGLGTLVVVALWWRVFPSLRGIDRIDLSPGE